MKLPTSFNTYYAFLIFLTCSYLNCFSQVSSIKGTIISAKNKKPIKAANILIKLNKEVVLYYAITNNNGVFSIENIDSTQIAKCFIEVTALGFATNATNITTNTNFYSIELTEQPKLLDSVTVKTIMPIKKRGDTISYTVTAFEREEDRTIGDVLKRLPGISVDDNGQISFNGKKYRTYTFKVTI